MLESKQALNLNISSQCLQLLFQLVYGFTAYDGKSVQEGANYFIAVRNCTGLPLTVRLQDDGGIANMMDGTAQVNVDSLDKAFFAGLAEMQIAERVAICWVELHELVPFIRVFLRIPFLREVGKSDYFGSSFELFLCEPENGEDHSVKSADESEVKSALPDTSHPPFLFPVLSFVNQQSDSLGQTVVISVVSKEEQSQWTRYANEIKKRYDASLSATASEVLPPRYGVLYFSAEDSTLATALPAHPSLALLQMGLPFRRIRKRSLLFEFDGYPSFSCNVDELKEQAVLLDSKDMNSLQFLIRSEMKRGRKVITVGTPIEVCNETACVLSYSIKENIRKKQRDEKEKEVRDEDDKESDEKENEDYDEEDEEDYDEDYDEEDEEDDDEEDKEDDKKHQMHMVDTKKTVARETAEIEMEKGRNYFVPYLFLENGLISFQLNNAKSTTKAKTVSTELILTKKANGTINFGTTDDPIYLSACEEIREIPIMGMPGITLTTFRLVFSDILEVENCIPEPLEMGFVNPSGRMLAIRMIRPGGREIIRQFMFLKREGTRISLRLAERNFEFSQYKDSIAVSSIE